NSLCCPGDMFRTQNGKAIPPRQITLGRLANRARKLFRYSLFQGVEVSSPARFGQNTKRIEMTNTRSCCFKRDDAAENASHKLAPKLPLVPAGFWPLTYHRVEAVQNMSCCLRSEEHTSELQSLAYLVCRLLLEKKKKFKTHLYSSYVIIMVCISALTPRI